MLAIERAPIIVMPMEHAWYALRQDDAQATDRFGVLDNIAARATFDQLDATAARTLMLA
jgi:hypothetical protein